MRRPALAAESHAAATRAALGVLGELGVADLPLGPLTTYRVGGPAAVGCRARSLADLGKVAAAVAVSGLPVLVVGRGSNLLVSDAGFPGIAVLLEAPGFSRLEVEGDTVRAGAAVPLPVLARRSADASLTGAEWAVGVPGSVGGAVRMNAGGHGSDVASTLIAAEMVDLGLAGSAAGARAGIPEVRTVHPGELRYGYRSSSLRADQVVVGAAFGLRPGDARASREEIRNIVAWRREHQPGGQNAGSVFVNPAGAPPANSAGWLVEASGLKGARVGSAEVSPKHANFIQATAGGSADDVMALVDHVRSEVHRRFGVLLDTEVRLVGFGSYLGEVQPRVEG